MAERESNYFREIRIEGRISSSNVVAVPSGQGTSPVQVVDYAKDIFLNGSVERSIRAKAFDYVYVVFDRDSHSSYHQALQKITALNGKYKNLEGVAVPFIAIASVPCFELWYLLHYEDVNTPIQRSDVYTKLSSYLPNYQKGSIGNWAATKSNLDDAIARARYSPPSIL